MKKERQQELIRVINPQFEMNNRPTQIHLKLSRPILRFPLQNQHKLYMQNFLPSCQRVNCNDRATLNFRKQSMQRKFWTRLRIKRQLSPTVTRVCPCFGFLDAAEVALKNPNQTKTGNSGTGSAPKEEK
jgi:hypothetical protein